MDPFLDLGRAIFGGKLRRLISAHLRTAAGPSRERLVSIMEGAYSLMAIVARLARVRCLGASSLVAKFSAPFALRDAVLALRSAVLGGTWRSEVCACLKLDEPVPGRVASILEGAYTFAARSALARCLDASSLRPWTCCNDMVVALDGILCFLGLGVEGWTLDAMFAAFPDQG